MTTNDTLSAIAAGTLTTTPAFPPVSARLVAARGS